MYFSGHSPSRITAGAGTSPSCMGQPQGLSGPQWGLGQAPTPTEIRTTPDKRPIIIEATMNAHIHSFLETIQVDADTLLTPDVKETSNFMDALKFAAKEYNMYQ